MSDMEKLESIVACLDRTIHNAEWADQTYTDCDVEFLKLVLDILKAQIPRMMKLEEVKMLDRDYYYLEAMRSPGKELRWVVGAYDLKCVTWPSITWARHTMGDRGYGKTWRCWTARPDQATREATPWE